MKIDSKIVDYRIEQAEEEKSAAAPQPIELETSADGKGRPSAVVLKQDAVVSQSMPKTWSHMTACCGHSRSTTKYPAMPMLRLRCC